VFRTLRDVAAARVAQEIRQVVFAIDLKDVAEETLKLIKGKTRPAPIPTRSSA
jgi:hypothetical protein